MKKRLLIMMAIVMAVTPAAPLMAQETVPAEEAPIDMAQDEEPAPVEEDIEEDESGQDMEALEEETAEDPDESLMAVKNGWADENGRTTYYVDGKKVKPVTVMKIDGRLYYFDIHSNLTDFDGFYSLSAGAWMGSPRESSGNFNVIYVKDRLLMTGLQAIDGRYYYFSPDTGFMARSSWRSLNGKTYYFDRFGEKVTGWQTINSYRYYFGSDGAQRTGWQTINGKTYYFFPKTAGTNYKGTLATGWQTINGYKYYFGSGGAQRTGWQTISGKTYYFFPKTTGKNYKGTLATGWQTINGYRYYFDSKGVQALGLKKIGTKLYYFWPKTSGNHYKGTMAKSTTVTVSGTKYAIGKDGVATRK